LIRSDEIHSGLNSDEVSSLSISICGAGVVLLRLNIQQSAIHKKITDIIATTTLTAITPTNSELLLCTKSDDPGDETGALDTAALTSAGTRLGAVSAKATISSDSRITEGVVA